MPATTLYMLIVIGVVYILYIYLTARRRKKIKASFANVDMRVEEGNAASYSQELLVNDYPWVIEEMKNAQIQAFTIANLDLTAKDEVKNIGKDLLKSAATLGTVRFKTVQTPKFLVLSGDALHLLDTDVDGKISNHFIFDKANLQNASLKEESISSILTVQAKFTGNVPKQYRLILDADGKKINILLFNVLVDTFADATTKSFFFGDTDKYVKKCVVASYFLKKLGEKIPVGKIETSVLS